jgi:hypothetical protein
VIHSRQRSGLMGGNVMARFSVLDKRLLLFVV